MMTIESRRNSRVIEHTLADDTLTRLRDIGTEPRRFREGLVRLGHICGYELADEVVETQKTRVQTPLSETEAVQTQEEGTVVVNVLRAATPFVEGIVKAFPNARQGVISASREESTENQRKGFPVTVEYVKMPEIDGDDTVIVADPMLATGSTMSSVLDRIEEISSGDPDIFVLSVVSAPEGIEKIADEHPEVHQVTVSVDNYLNEDGYIVPGLGDAGDRAFGTI
jgi:uracil phosphoribosyltransferase